MNNRPEFSALKEENRDLFKKEVYSLIREKLCDSLAHRYLTEANKILKNIQTKPKPKKEIKIFEEKVSVEYMPINEVNVAINTNRTTWATAKDGSLLEITPNMAKYLAELYKTLNTSHKDKLVNLMLESEHGFKKAVKTAEKLYRR